MFCLFFHLQNSVPIGNVQICKAELSEIPRCECKPDQEDACTSDCLNRMMMYECNPTVCPAGEKCHNQRFQRRQYPECEPFKSETRGWGLRCLEDVKKVWRLFYFKFCFFFFFYLCFVSYCVDENNTFLCRKIPFCVVKMTRWWLKSTLPYSFHLPKCLVFHMEAKPTLDFFQSVLLYIYICLWNICYLILCVQFF